MPLEEQNGDGFYYVIQWSRQVLSADLDLLSLNGRVLASDDAVQSHKIFNSSVGQLTVENQPNFQPYNISVQAANSEGFAVSPYQKVIGYSAEDGE